MTTTSISLLERLRLPSEHAAWRQFVHLYTPLIFDWARGMGMSASDAEDVVQDVMTVLVRRLPEFRYDENGSFRAWLRTITVNRCRDFHRRSGVRPHTTGAGSVDVETPDGADALVEEEYRQSLVSRALELIQNQFDTTTWKACWDGQKTLKLAPQQPLAAMTNAERDETEQIRLGGHQKGAELLAKHGKPVPGNDPNRVN